MHGQGLFHQRKYHRGDRAGAGSGRSRAADPESPRNTPAVKQPVTACRGFAAAKSRKIFIEYAFFDEVNDSFKDADALLRLLEGLDCSINLITGNPVNSPDFQPSSRETALVFQKHLIAGGIRTMLRVSRGADIEAGCGQLRSRWLD